MATSPKDKFEAAVKVINGLPKNGSFQPSHELMLKFYSYFKQATEGPCRSPKPAFWDVVSKKKWEAWSNLGDMRKEEAMLSYVDELKKIVETMPQTDAVTEFLQKLDSFYEMVEDSENHNTLKMLDKPRANGSIGSNLGSENGDEGDLPASYRVTQLLKHDVKCWKDNSGFLSAGSNVTNGHGLRFEHNGNGSSFEHIGSDDDDDGDDDDDDDDDRDEYDRQKNDPAEEKLIPGSVSCEGWEQVDESRLSVSHSESTGGSESESEEFCDTSDDPVELAIPASPHVFVSCLPPLAEQLAEKSSTPNPNGGKSVHFSPRTSIMEVEASDNLVVDTPQRDTQAGDPPINVQLADTLPTEALCDADHTDDMDILTCRGGDDQGRDRRRPAGGQGTRDGASSANRDSRGSSGGAGGSNSGGGGQRDFFSGPGGGGGWRGAGSGGNMSPTDLNEQIVVTLLRLQHDMSGVLNRLNSLEALVKEGKKEKDKTVKIKKTWWPFPDLSVKSALIIFVWPLLVHCVITYISHRRRKLKR